ncbi:hypothetical protein 0305phi8-36p243 [Bacillus phage 0305phi8-36]|nr:hypothetical protein ST0305phi8-36p243 [Bacillus phage 0305phi8-36]ABS83809.1 hypothetical protein 0305phi8-36p243 [Bacillus phage 0305phi8-36]
MPGSSNPNIFPPCMLIWVLGDPFQQCNLDNSLLHLFYYIK